PPRLIRHKTRLLLARAGIWAERASPRVGSSGASPHQMRPGLVQFRFSFCPACAHNQGFMTGTVTQAARPQNSFDLAFFAVMVAGACTFLNVYCTQPLLPLFQRIFHASEIKVSLTVG